MLYLLESDDFVLLEALESKRQGFSRVISVLHKSHTTKGSSSKSRDEVEIIQIVLASPLPTVTTSDFLLSDAGGS